MSPKCPQCKLEINPDKDLFMIPFYENFQKTFEQHYQPSAKIQKVLEIIQCNPHSKIVIFSHFISMLELLKGDLKRRGIALEYINGSTPERNRKEIIRRFKKNNNTYLLLISIKVGGFGLNLTEANVVVILEPWWNPAIEDQAIDRVNRIGQKVISYYYNQNK